MADPQDIFSLINNAVLDLQSADLQSYPAPLQRLGRLLNHPDLQPINRDLVDSVDVETFIRESEKTQGGMVGSARLQWPDDDVKILALQFLLIMKFADNPDYMADFGGTFFFSSSNKIMASVQNVISQLVIPFARDYRNYVEGRGQLVGRVTVGFTKKVFIVHGHDAEARETVARFLTRAGLDPIILNEQANKGRTIIEKIEANRDVGFAVVLLTPDDLGRSSAEKELEPRARQNVLLELGYFMSHLGRDKVCALRKGEVAIPSDFAGVVWERMDDQDGWKVRLLRELKAAGHQVDFEKAFS